MFRQIVLPLLAVAGVVLAIMTVKAGNQVAVPAPPAAKPAQSKFDHSVAGAGLVEASTENIAIGTAVPGVVSEVLVSVGDAVRAGQPLFRIDDREIQATLRIRQAEVVAAKQELARQTQLPRAEDLPALEARLKSAESVLANRQRELERMTRASASASTDERERARLDLETAQADLEAARGELAKLRAGAWEPELAIARAAVDSAKANLAATQVELDRRTILSPIDGQAMQVKTRKGEYAQAGPLATPLMLVGNTGTLHVRVDVDENDAWRVRKGARAIGSVRGNSELETELAFVRIEPYVVPKRSLTGDSSERVDTRVLQVVFSFPADKLPVYPGQQLDVYIEVEK